MIPLLVEVASDSDAVAVAIQQWLGPILSGGGLAVIVSLWRELRQDWREQRDLVTKAGIVLDEQSKALARVEVALSSVGEEISEQSARIRSLDKTVDTIDGAQKALDGAQKALDGAHKSLERRLKAVESNNNHPHPH